MAVRGPWRSLIPRTTATIICVNVRNKQLTTEQYHFVTPRFSAQSTCNGQLQIEAYLWQEDSVWLPRNGALPGHPQNPFGSPKPAANASCKGSAQRGRFHVSWSLHFDLQGLDNNKTGLPGAAGCMLLAVSIPWRLTGSYNTICMPLQRVPASWLPHLIKMALFVSDSRPNQQFAGSNMQSNRAAAHLIELLHLLKSLKQHETVQRFKHCRAGCVWSRYARLFDISKHSIKSYLARLVHNHTAQASRPQTLFKWRIQVRKQGRAP